MIVRLFFIALPGALAFAAPEPTIRHQWQIPDAQELATVIRTVLDVTEVNVSPSAGIIEVRAPASVMSGVDWLMQDLMQPEDIRSRSSHEYRIPADRLLTIRAVYLNSDTDVERVQELVTMLRTVTGMPKVLSLTRPKALIMRGSEPEEQLAAWLIEELQNPRNKANGYSGVHQFRVGAKDDVARIFFADRKDDPDFAPIAKKIYATHKRAFYVSSSAAMIVRGTADRIASDEKLIGVR